MSSIFEMVKEKVTAREVAERYGMKIGRNQMTCCPFHDDRHPSMKVDQRYYCFACGAKGDAINLAGKLLDMKPYDAAKKITQDFGIHIQEEKTHKRRKRKLSKEKESLSEWEVIRQADEWINYSIKVIEDYQSMMFARQRRYEPKSPDEDLKDEFVEASNILPVLGWYLDILFDGELEDKLRFLKEKGGMIREFEKRMELQDSGYENTGRGGYQCHGIIA